MAEAILGDLSGSGIYQIRNLVNGKRYVGSSVRLKKRWAEHLKDLAGGDHHAKALQRAWNKYGADAFVFSVLEFCGRDVLIDREQHHLDQGSHYNTCKFAASMLGVSPSAETRAKLSEKLKGRVFTEEHRKKISDALNEKIKNGWSVPAESIRRSAEKRRGRKASAETRAKLSLKRKGKRVLPVGYRHSAEIRQKIAERMRLNPTFLGKIHSNETKLSLSLGMIERWNDPESRAVLMAAMQSEDRRRRISEAVKGNKNFLGRSHSDETKEKLRNMFLGRQFSEETRRRMSSAQKSRLPISQETRDKMSQSRSGLRNGSAIKDEVTLRHDSGEVLTGIPMELRRVTGISPSGMSQLLNGVQRVAKGWRLVSQSFQ
ncbi:TPA: NUMOD3 domain-containing DNA-binding protein [Pseudomonas aeruginosa]